jgi:hypothetical protein
VRQDHTVPDDFDYAWLDDFIDDAPNWSQDDLETTRFHLANQRQAVSEADPRDLKTREALQQVVHRLERAIQNRGGV